MGAILGDADRGGVDDGQEVRLIGVPSVAIIGGEWTARLVSGFGKDGRWTSTDSVEAGMD